MNRYPSNRPIVRTILSAAALLIAASAGAAAQDGYPSRTIKIIVPFPAGGTLDVLTRIVGERLAAKWGQPVVVENRVGAVGNIGTEAAARAEPDGYTLLASPPPGLVINQHLGAKLSYDPAAFVPVTVMGAVPNVLAINPGVPVKSVAELVAYAKANPDKLTFASTGPASILHMPMEVLRTKTGIEVSDLCGVKPHVLRYWEQEFTQLRPVKRRGNRRYYQHHEVLLIRRIRELLYEQGFTISGARNRLDDHDQSERVAPRTGLVAANDPAAVNGDGTHVKAVDIAALHAELAAIRKLLRSR